MRYEDVESTSREEAELAFASQDPDRVARALVAAALHDPDWKWVQDWCLRFIDGSDQTVRRIAVTCLGHLARLHRTMDIDRVLPLLNDLRSDEVLAGRVDDALDDIHTFIPSTRGGR